MAKDSDKLRGGFDAEETGGALSGLLAEEDEFDRRTLWRLGTWAVASVGAVVVALVANQSSIGLRREQTASADLMKQAQQLQLTAKESQSENRRLASAVDTLNSDRDRLYSRVAVLEQGLDSVTGAIARQAPPPSSPQASAGQTNSGQASTGAPAPASASAPSAASPSTTPVASLPRAVTASTEPAPSAPAATASSDAPPAPAKPTPAAPVVASVTATAPAAVEKKEKQAAATPPSQPDSSAKPPSSPQTTSTQASGTLIASKSMMDPPDPAAAKLIEPLLPPRPSSPPKTFTSAPIPEIAAVAPKEKPEEAEPESAAAPEPVVVRRTEFGVDVGGANSVSGLRALWRGLLKSHANAALTALRPVIVIKENTNGLGMQLRLVAGPINDAAAAAKICASLTVSDRGCTTAVFEGQRLTMGADEQPRAETRESRPASSDGKPAAEAKLDADSKSTSKFSGHRRYIPKRQAIQEDPPKPEPSTLSLIFGKH